MKYLNGFPRRANLQYMTPAELSIYHAIVAVEKVGASVNLTSAVLKLQEALTHLSDHVDEQLHGGTE